MGGMYVQGMRVCQGIRECEYKADPEGGGGKDSDVVMKGLMYERKFGIMEDRGGAAPFTKSWPVSGLIQASIGWSPYVSPWGAERLTWALAGRCAEG